MTAEKLRGIQSDCGVRAIEVPTRSVLTNEKDADGDDMIPSEHVTKSLRNRLDEGVMGRRKPWKN